MTGLSALTFLNPWALAGLVILPVIYWLLRFIPPKPQSVRFPPFRLLLDLISKEEETDKTPWWLVLLRLALASAIIIAVAQPVLTDNKQMTLNKAPLLIIIDNDWSTANHWLDHQTILLQTIQAARSRDIPVALATTTGAAQTLKMQTAKSAQNLAATISPQSLVANRQNLLTQLTKSFLKSDALQIIWLSNGLTDHKTGDKTGHKTGGKQDSFVTGLRTLANGKAAVTIATPSPAKSPIILGKLLRNNGKIDITLHKQKHRSTDKLAVSLLAGNGRNLAQASFDFAPGKTSQKASITLPLALRNEAARIEISGQNHAGAIRLLDDRWQRKTVGIITGEALALAQPLLSPLYYVTRALAPTAQIQQHNPDASTTKLLEAGLSMLVLADIGIIVGKDRSALESWVEKGGVLVRFAGPRLAKSTESPQTDASPDQRGPDKPGMDRLIPVELRRGGRALGSALSWEQPQGLAPFPQNSPLAGLKLDPTVKIRRQVLAEPTADLTGHVWASLTDGTPLITARRQGQGLVVLVHVTANSDWSNLPLSGLFVEILKRLLDLAPAITTTDNTDNETANPATANSSDAFVPHSSLDGFGKLLPAPPTAKPLNLQGFANTTPSLDHPAGLYRRGAGVQALNLVINPAMLSPLATNAAGVKNISYTPAPVWPLAGLLFVVAFLLLLIDTLATLLLMGGWQRITARRSLTTSLGSFCLLAVAMQLALSLTLFPAPVIAQSVEKSTPSAITPPITLPITPQEQIAMDAVTQTRFAYVRTGDETIDATSLAGLTGLNLALNQRTSVDPGPPQMIDLEKDQIVFYPLLYWPVLEQAQPLSDAVVTKLSAFMRNGGTIFFDTRDQNATFATLTGNVSGPTRALRRILAKFDIPALEPVPPKHVLTRAFYLMQQFPGRWLNGKLWVEASTTDKSQIDGVSSIIIGANDYASAWAIDATGRPLYTTILGTPRQREFAYRTGINIVMYTLTGNYKADQVHIPALLERLGE